MAPIPTFDQYFNSVLRALRDLGGSATIREIYEKVVEEMKLSDDQLAVIHNEERGSQTEVDYRLAWARTYLKKAGLLDNSKRGVWVLTRQGQDTPEVDSAEIGLFITTSTHSRGAEQEATKPGTPLIDLINGDQLIDLLKQLELGVKTELVEEVTGNGEWFQGI